MSETDKRQQAITAAGNPAKPTGEAGEQMLARMNESHGPLTAWGLSHFNWRGDETVLDIGCGGGATLKRMSDCVTTGHLTGIDYSETSVRTSRQTNTEAIKAGKMDVSQGSVEKLPFAGDSFDKITTVESFYFWPDPPENLKEVSRVLKKGGTFLLIAEIYERPDLSPATRENIKHYNLYNPTPETFETIFRKAGFTAVTVHIEPNEGWICVEGIK
ncbi:class I SAM-dependent methyltransferase [uncultured Megasphaera sp.]|uniref:class I SAM-dependent methyltransferase n=1 Tax=uncultured Megasphaera sp. TaxID=165188 RepID=UPI00265FD388|nr:class I SAM-dependent methyltransferase [uncultured Megasphaera sp.]